MEKNRSNIIYKSLELDTTEGRGWWEDENGNFFVRSYFTDDNPDYIGDIIERRATDKAVSSWRKWGNIRMQHNPDRPIGKVSQIGESDKLEWNRYIARIIDEEAKKLVKAGVLSATSVGIYVLAYDEIDMEDVDYERSPLARVSWFPPIRITEYEMVEMSLVDNPMNEAAVVGGKMRVKMTDGDIRKIVDARADALSSFRRKGATAYQGFPFADDDTLWDANDAMVNLAAWASSDGSGDKDKIDLEKYRKGFFWYDETGADKVGSYKLPFVNVFDGTAKAVWSGVAAAAQRLSGTDVPDGDVSGVKAHIKKYYSKHGDEVPWEEMKFSDKGVEPDASVEDDRYHEKLPETADAVATDIEEEQNMEVEKTEEQVDETTVEPIEPEVEEVEVETDDDGVEQVDFSLLLDNAVSRLFEKIDALNVSLAKSFEDVMGKIEEAQKSYVEEKEDVTEPTVDDLIEAAKPVIEGIIQAELEKAAPRKSEVDVPQPDEGTEVVKIEDIYDREQLLGLLREKLRGLDSRKR